MNREDAGKRLRDDTPSSDVGSGVRLRLGGGRVDLRGFVSIETAVNEEASDGLSWRNTAGSLRFIKSKLHRGSCVAPSGTERNYTNKDAAPLDIKIWMFKLLQQACKIHFTNNCKQLVIVVVDLCLGESGETRELWLTRRNRRRTQVCSYLFIPLGAALLQAEQRKAPPRMARQDPPHPM